MTGLMQLKDTKYQDMFIYVASFTEHFARKNNQLNILYVLGIKMKSDRNSFYGLIL